MLPPALCVTDLCVAPLMMMTEQACRKADRNGKAVSLLAEMEVSEHGVRLSPVGPKQTLTASCTYTVSSTGHATKG